MLQWIYINSARWESSAWSILWGKKSTNHISDRTKIGRLSFSWKLSVNFQLEPLERRFSWISHILSPFSDLFENGNFFLKRSLNSIPLLWNNDKDGFHNKTKLIVYAKEPREWSEWAGLLEISMILSVLFRVMIIWTKRYIYLIMKLLGFLFPSRNRRRWISKNATIHTLHLVYRITYRMHNSFKAFTDLMNEMKFLLDKSTHIFIHALNWFLSFSKTNIFAFIYKKKSIHGLPPRYSLFILCRKLKVFTDLISMNWSFCSV